MDLKKITSVPFELPEDVLRILTDNSTVVSYKRNENLLQRGDKDTDFYFIKSGLARIYYPPTKECSKEENLLFGEAGNVAASVSSFILGLPAVFSIAAVTKLTAYRIKSDVIRELYKSNETFCRWLLELSMIQLAYLEIRHTYLAAEDAYQRLLNFIRFKPKSFMRRVPQYHIASYLKISPTTFSLLKNRYSHDPENKMAYDKEFLDAVGITGEAPE